MSIVFNFSNCKVSVKYLKKVNNSKNWYYVRRIPKDLLDHEHYASKNDKRIDRRIKLNNPFLASDIFRHWGYFLLAVIIN
jgi:hypothetical protein